jgi:hypothetical protein
MAANAAAAREFERAEENSEVRSIPTLERALRPLSRTVNKEGWPSIGQLMSPKKIQKKTVMHIPPAINP